jgi:tape measure domain-containing protein
MATAAKHDVPLTLTVETVGLESIKQLKTDVAALGKQGADAVPEFAKLGAEIDRLADQAALVTAFGRLSDEVDQLSAAQSTASTRSKELTDKLLEQSAATNTLRATELEAKKALELAQQALFEKKQALAELKNGTSDYTAQARIQTAEIIKARGEIRELGQSYKAAKAEASAAAATEKELGNQVKTTTAITSAASKSLSERSAALNSTKGALTAAGIATDDFAAAEAALTAAHTKLTAEVAATGQALASAKAKTQEMAEADRLLAIEQRGLAELFEKGRVALIAEETAYREATRASAAYAANKEAENAARARADELWQKEAFAIVENAEARARNARETKLLIEAQNFLIAQDADAKWLEEAAALSKVNEAAFALRREKERLADAEQQVANDAALATAALKKIDDAAREAGAGIANALGTVGVRSATEIRIEIDKVTAALNLLKNSGTLVGPELQAAFTKGGSKIKELERDLREANGQMTLIDRTARAFSGAMGQFTVATIAANAVMALAQRVQELGRAFIDAVVQGDSMRRGLNAIYKDSTLAAQQMDFLRKTAMENGVAVGGLTTDFVRFSASMKSANIPLEQSNALFKALTRASSSLGLGTEATAGALNALGQMASKGVVSMEELRQQLGDRLPGALGLAAKGMGITEAQLVALVSSGQLAARDFFGPFTEALKTMEGETDGLINTYDRLKSVLTETSQSAGDSGWTALLTTALKALGGAVGAVVLSLSALSELIFGVAKAGGVLAAAVVTWTNPWAALSKILDDAAGRQGKLTASFDTAIGVGDKAAESTVKQAAAMTTSTAATTKAIAANAALSGEQKLLALSTALAADKTLDAGAKIVQYTVAATELIAKQGQQTEAYGKMAKAAKEEGDSMVARAKLTGDNIVIQDASTKAAELHAAALDKVRLSGEAEVAMLVAQKAELIASASGRQGGVEAVKVQIAELDKLIVKGSAEVEQSRQASAAAAQQVVERKLLSETLKDNSSKMELYAAEMKAATVEIESLRAAESRGYDVKVGLATANERLATSTALYRDAVKDSITNTELDTKVKGANLQLSIAQATASGNHYAALAAEARSLGDVTLAQHYEIEAKKESIRVLELKLKLDKLQQDADLLTIEIKRKLINAETDEGKQKLKLLDIETQMIKIRQAGNQAVLDQIRVIDAEVVALRNGTNTRDGSRQAIDKETGSRDRNTDAIYDGVSALEAEIATKEKAADLKARQLKLDQDSGKTMVGKSIDQVPSFDSVASATQWKKNRDEARAKAGGASGSQWSAVVRSWEDAEFKAELEAATNKEQAGFVNTASQQGFNQTQADQLASDYMIRRGNGQNPGTFDDFIKSRQATSKPTTTVRQGGGVDSFATAKANTTNTVNITIGGVSTQVNVASAADANNLQSVLQQLAAAQGRSI